MKYRLKNYFNINNRKEIYFLALSIIFIAFFIISSGCEKDKNTNQSEKKEVPAKNLHLDINCTGYIINDVLNEGSANYLIIDTVEWFSGDDAVKAFNMDKKEGKSKTNETPNGYYIRNVKIDSLKFKISDTANVVMQTLSYNQFGNFNFNERIQVSKFISLLNDKEYQRFKFKLYKFHILDNEIVSIKERYIP